MTVYFKPLLPIKCLIPLDVPQVEVAAPAPRVAVVTWADGLRQRVFVVYEDALTREAYIRYWVRVGHRVEAVAAVVSLDRLER